MPTTTRDLLTYDEFVDDRLGRVRNSVKLRDLATAGLLMVTGCLALLILLVVIDHWCLDLGIWGRLAGFAILLGWVTYCAVARIIPVLFRRVNPAYAAKVIEEGEPSLKNRLLNFVLFRSHRSDLKAVVYEAVKEEAATELTEIEVESTVDYDRQVRFAAAMAVMVMALGVYTAVSPKSPFATLGRVLLPWRSIARPSRVLIDDVQPGTTEVYFGRRVPISARIERLPDDENAMVVFSSTDERIVNERLIMSLDELGDRYAVELPPGGNGLREDLTYRIEAGDAVSDSYRLRMIPAPSIIVERVEYEFPAYTQQPNEVVEHEGDLSAIEGTRIKIQASTNQPISSAYLEFDPAADGSMSRTRKTIKMTHDGTTASVRFQLRLQKDGRTPVHTSYNLRFQNRDNEFNSNPIRYSIDVIPDLKPEVEVLEPARLEVEVPINSVQAIDVRALDPDFALTELSLLKRHPAVAGNEIETVKLIQEPAAGQVTERYLFSPQRLGLEVGQVVTFTATARDNRHDPLSGELAPNSTTTEEYRLRIVGPVEGRRDPRQPSRNDDRNERDDSEARDDNPGREGDDRMGDQGDGAEGDGNQGDQGQADQGQGNQGAGDRRGEDVGGGPDGEGQDSSDGAGGGEQGNQQGSGDAGGDESGSGEQGSGRGEQGSEQDESQDGQGRPESSDSSGTGAAENTQGSEGTGRSGDTDTQRMGEGSGEGGQGDQSQGTSGQQQAADGDQETAGQNRSGQNQSSEAQSGNAASQAEESPLPSDGSQDPDVFDRVMDEMRRRGESTEPGEESTDPQASSTGDPQSGASRDSPPSDRSPPSDQQSGQPSSQGQPGEQQDEQRGQPQSGESQPQQSESQQSESQQSESQQGESQQGEPQSTSQSQPGDRSNQQGDQSAQPSETSPNAEPSRQTSDQQGEEGDRQGGSQQGQSGQSQQGQGGQPGREPGGAESPDGTGTGEAGESGESPTGQQTGQSGQDTGQGSGRGGRGRGEEGEGGPESGGESSTTEPGEGGSSATSQNETKGNRGADSRPGENGQPGADGAPGQGAPDARGQSDSQLGDGGEGSNDSQGESAGSNPSSPNERSADSASSSPEQSNADSADGEQTTDDEQNNGSSDSETTGQSGDGDQRGSGQQPGSQGGKQSGDQPASNAQPGSVAGQTPGQGAQRGGPEAPMGNSNTGGEEPGGDAANLDYANQATQLVIDYLKDQQEKPNQELLDRLGWTQEDLNRFVRRWERMQQDAKQPGEAGERAKRELDNALRSLGLQSTRDRTRTATDTDDDLSGVSDAGTRGRPPAQYRDRYKQFMRRREKSK